MSANINDKITSTRSGSTNAIPTTVSSARSIGGTSLSCVDLTGWPTDTAVHFISYRKKSDGTIDRSTQCDWKGIVSGTTIGSLTLKNGTDAGNEAGDFVEVAPTSAWGNDLADGILTSHNSDGTLKANSVDTQALQDKSVQRGKIDFASIGIKTAKDDTTYSPSSGSYAPFGSLSVTTTVGPSGILLVLWNAQGLKSDGDRVWSCPVLSGSNTTIPNDNDASSNANTRGERQSGYKLYTGLTPGSTTIALQHRISGTGSGNLSWRDVTAIPL